MHHLGSIPDQLYVVVTKEPEQFWVYLKEGHAINRMLKERQSGKECNIKLYIPTQETT